MKHWEAKQFTYSENSLAEPKRKEAQVTSSSLHLTPCLCSHPSLSNLYHYGKESLQTQKAFKINVENKFCSFTMPFFLHLIFVSEVNGYLHEANTVPLDIFLTCFPPLVQDTFSAFDIKLFFGSKFRSSQHLLPDRLK